MRCSCCQVCLKRYIKQVLSRPGSTHRYNKHIVNKTIQGIEQCILRFTPYLKRLRKPSPSRSPYRSCFLIHSLGGITHRPEPTPFFQTTLLPPQAVGIGEGMAEKLSELLNSVHGRVTRLEELEAETLLSLCEQVWIRPSEERNTGGGVEILWWSTRAPVVRVATRDKVSTFRASARIRVDRTVARRNDGLVDVGERR